MEATFVSSTTITRSPSGRTAPTRLPKERTSGSILFLALIVLSNTLYWLDNPTNPKLRNLATTGTASNASRLETGRSVIGGQGTKPDQLAGNKNTNNSTATFQTYMNSTITNNNGSSSSSSSPLLEWEMYSYANHKRWMTKRRQRMLRGYTKLVIVQYVHDEPNEMHDTDDMPAETTDQARWSNIRTMANLSQRVNRAYAKLHRLDYVRITMTTTFQRQQQRQRDNQQQPPQNDPLLTSMWLNKLGILQQLAVSKRYDAVLLLDANAVILDYWDSHYNATNPLLQPLNVENPNNVMVVLNDDWMNPENDNNDPTRREKRYPDTTAPGCFVLNDQHTTTLWNLRHANLTRALTKWQLSLAKRLENNDYDSDKDDHNNTKEEANQNGEDKRRRHPQRSEPPRLCHHSDIRKTATPLATRFDGTTKLRAAAQQICTLYPVACDHEADIPNPPHADEGLEV